MRCRAATASSCAALAPLPSSTAPRGRGAIRAPATSVSVDEKFVPFFKTGKELRERLNRNKENH